jgi:hypothetical protein
MAGQGGALRSTLITFFPMFIAALSLFTSIYNGYLNGKFVDFIQRNVERTESMRTCKEIIEAYFQVKARANLIRRGASESSEGQPRGVAAEQIEAANALAKFGALGTYLANFRDDATRTRYTQLSIMLDQILARSAEPTADIKRLFESADREFVEMNADCIRSARPGA